MNILQAIILGIVQGLTEFIPVSSSGHLVFLHEAFGVRESGMVFDVALHLGTLLALIIFFHSEIYRLIKGFFGKNDYQKLSWFLIIATVPAAILGYLFQDMIDSNFRSAKLVAINLIIIAIFMLLAEQFAKRYSDKTKLKKISLKQSFLMGLMQALALYRVCRALVVQ